MFKLPPYILLLTLSSLFIFGILGSVFLAQYIIDKSSRDAIRPDLSELPQTKVALVLGCGRYLSDGRENLFFKYRIQAAADLFKAGKVRSILVSGDNHTAGYNEPEDMKAALMEKGIPEKRIVCDYAGFSTLDSIVRARKVFGQTRFIVVSQEFHNRRAIFIGKNKGLDLYGYNARKVDAFNSFKTNIRESLARVKTVLDVWVLHRQPKFLGEPIQIAENGFHDNS